MYKTVSILISMLWIGSCGGGAWTENPTENICSNTDMNAAVACLNALPKENIRDIPEVDNYLANHKVYISLTSSPTRLKNAIWMLKTIDLEHVEKIFLSLPEKYRNEEDYGEIPTEILAFPKVERIASDSKDIGPATKILYALDHVRNLDPDAIVISLDDDTGLPAGAIGQLIKFSVLYPNAVVGASGRYAGLFGVNYSQEWPKDNMTTAKPYCGEGAISYCHILEGYKGVAYKPRLVNTEKILSLGNTSKACLMSDDFVIGYALAQDNVDRIRIANEYFYQVNQFSFGFEGDALQRIPTKKKKHADGFEGRFSWAGLVGVGETAERYQRCAYDLLKREKS